MLCEMKATGRGKSGRGGAGCGRGNIRERVSSRTTSQPLLQPIRVIGASLETGQSSNPSVGALRTEQMSTGRLQRISLETQSSRNQQQMISPSNEAETGAVSRVNLKRGRGVYKSKTIDVKTKYGGKITIMIPEDINRAVGSGARDIVNYSGLIMRSTISFRNGNWQNIVLKHGEAMWLKVKDKFEACVGVREHRMQAFVIDTMRRLFRSWKARLHIHYSKFDTDEERLSKWPADVELEDWKFLVEHFGSEEFKAVSERNKRNREKQITKHSCGTRSFAEVEESTRNPLSGEKDTPDNIWALQHTRKNANGERVFLDPQSEEIHGKLRQLVAEQQSEDIQHPMTGDEILSSVLGERSGYVRGKGYGKKPPRKAQMQQADVEASVTSAVESMRQEMQADMERKIQEKRESMDQKLQQEREQMAADWEKKREEEREHMRGEMEKMLQVQMVAIMSRMQQGQVS